MDETASRSDSLDCFWNSVNSRLARMFATVPLVSISTDSRQNDSTTQSSQYVWSLGSYPILRRKCGPGGIRFDFGREIGTTRQKCLDLVLREVESAIRCWNDVVGLDGKCFLPSFFAQKFDGWNALWRRRTRTTTSGSRCFYWCWLWSSSSSDGFRRWGWFGCSWGCFDRRFGFRVNFIQVSANFNFVITSKQIPRWNRENSELILYESNKKIGNRSSYTTADLHGPKLLSNDACLGSLDIHSNLVGFDQCNNILNTWCATHKQ